VKLEVSLYNKTTKHAYYRAKTFEIILLI